MFMNENEMIVNDAMERIDSVLNLQPMSEPNKSDVPKDYSITINNLTYSYDGQKNAINKVSFDNSVKANGRICRSVRQW